MKSQKGMSHITVIFIIIIMIVIVTIGVRVLLKANEERYITNLTTDMQLLQAKVKVIASENIIKKDERPLEGKQVKENLEDEIIKRLLENKIIDQEEENFDKYYIIDESMLGKYGLYNYLEGEYYIVSYSSYEIIFTKGVEIDNNMVYKLTDLLKYRDEKDKTEDMEDMVNEDVQTNQEVQTNTEA